MRIRCPNCNGAGRIKTGEPLGSCDGPQYSDCSKCNGECYIEGTIDKIEFQAECTFSNNSKCELLTTEGNLKITGQVVKLLNLEKDRKYKIIIEEIQ